MVLSPDLCERLAALPDLPSPPVAALRIVELSKDPDASLPQLARIVNCDPALATRILRASNSVAFGRGRQCQNLRQALVVLGMDTTMTIALSFSLVNALRNSTKDGLDHTRFWKRSLLAAVAARSIGEFTQQDDRDNLFLAGLLQDIGMLATNLLDRTIYTAARRDGNDHQSLAKREQDTLGADHVDIGVWLLERWNMPDYLCTVVAASHTLEPTAHTGELGRISACVALSGLMADIWTADDRRELLQRLSDNFAVLLGIDATDVGFILAKVREQVPAAEALFEIPLVEEQRMQEVLGQAMETILAGNLTALKEAGAILDAAVNASRKGSPGAYLQRAGDALAGLGPR